MSDVKLRALFRPFVVLVVDSADADGPTVGPTAAPGAETEDNEEFWPCDTSTSSSTLTLTMGPALGSGPGNVVMGMEVGGGTIRGMPVMGLNSAGSGREGEGNSANPRTVRWRSCCCCCSDGVRRGVEPAVGPPCMGPGGKVPKPE